MLSVGLTMKKGSVSEMLHGSVGTWLNGVKTNARSRERTSVGGGLLHIYEMQWVQNASSLCIVALCVSLSWETPCTFQISAFWLFSCYAHVRLLFLMDLAINQHYGANVNSIHASFIFYSPNEQSLFTILTELQYLTNYNT